MLSIHQFIGFSPLNKSAGKATEVNTAIRRLVGRTSILPTDRGKPLSLAKRKRQPIFFTHRFAHAKNTLMSQRGYTPLDTPFVSGRSSKLSFGLSKG